MPEEIIETPEVLETEEVETTDLNSEVEKWKSLSRKNEAQAKANSQAAKELEELKKASLTDQEKLIASTREETAASVRREFAGKLVEAELKSAISGKTLDATSLLSFDRNSFIDESGEVDSNAIAAWVEAHTKAPEFPVPDLGQGIRGKSPSGKAQLTRADLAVMSNQQILEARESGQLDSLMGKN
jgi:hypothetical protein